MKKPTPVQAPVVITDGADKVAFRIEVHGGAALALRTAAVMDKESLLHSITSALAMQAAGALGDTNPQETPGYAELFGLEGEAAA